MKGNKSAFDVEVPPRLVNALSEKKILKIASGSQHSLALDEEGYVYAWGFAGYGRLGLQDSTDRWVVPIPVCIEHCTGWSQRSYRPSRERKCQGGWTLHVAQQVRGTRPTTLIVRLCCH